MTAGLGGGTSSTASRNKQEEKVGDGSEGVIKRAKIPATSMATIPESHKQPTFCDSVPAPAQAPSSHPGLRKTAPYWYPYRTNAKARWFDREILEIVSTEFRDRSVEYYRYALQSGMTTVNGKIALPGTIIRNGDTIENIVHRHEPAVTSAPVQLLVHDPGREFIVINKPGSIPVHAAGRYFKHSLIEMIKNELGFEKVYTVNRLDRLTSGLMIIALSPQCARSLSDEFQSGTVKKEYVARVHGEFPEEEVTCEEPLLTADRQMGLNIIHPEGKLAKTVFRRMHYDKKTDTSVVHCRPFTGRSHQIRVHLQYLGHSIANDAVYADEKVWGPRLGKGGIDITPDEYREAPMPPPGIVDTMASGHGREISSQTVTRNAAETSVLEPERSVSTPLSTLLPASCSTSIPSESAPPSRSASPRPMASESGQTSLRSEKSGKYKSKARNPAFRTKEESARLQKALKAEAEARIDVGPSLLPRETGHDIGMCSPVPLSRDAVDLIARLRNQKDEDEDWSRWRDVVFRAKGALHPQDIVRAYGQQRRNPKKGAKAAKRISQECEKVKEKEDATDKDDAQSSSTSSASASPKADPRFSAGSLQGTNTITPSSPLTTISADTASTTPPLKPGPRSGCEPLLDPDTNTLYCPECYLPLHPDPKLEKLYIFLHALRYTTESLGAFETALPEWAHPDWEWDQ